MDYIQNTNYDEEEDTLFKEENCDTKKEYIEKERSDGYFLSGIILETMVKKTHLIVRIYKNDARYRGEPWSIIEPIDERIDGVVLLFLEQGELCQTGHYQGIKLFNKHNLGVILMNTFRRNNTNLGQSFIHMKDKLSLNVLIIKWRLIRDYLKRILLIDILRSKEIDVALLQEIFLLKKDPLYF